MSVLFHIFDAHYFILGSTGRGKYFNSALYK